MSKALVVDGAAQVTTNLSSPTFPGMTTEEPGTQSVSELQWTPCHVSYPIEIFSSVGSTCFSEYLSVTLNPLSLLSYKG